VQVLGAKRKTLAGFSTATAQPHQGFIFNSDVIQQTPPGLRGKASRMVGAKCTLLARMDAYGQDPSGQAGEAMKVWGHSGLLLKLWRCAFVAAFDDIHPAMHQPMAGTALSHMLDAQSACIHLAGSRPGHIASVCCNVIACFCLL
jgi:hypothetical protein